MKYKKVLYEVIIFVHLQILMVFSILITIALLIIAISSFLYHILNCQIRQVKRKTGLTSFCKITQTCYYHPRSNESIFFPWNILTMDICVPDTWHTEHQDYVVYPDSAAISYFLPTHNFCFHPTQLWISL